MFRNLDWFTVTIYILLIVAGIVSIYAASYDFDNASMLSFDEFSGKQLRWVGLAIFAAGVILLIDFRLYEAYAYPIYALTIILLIATIFLAPDIKGSRSWLIIGPMSLQPAEFAKCATALALAKLFSAYNFSLNASPTSYLRALTVIFLPIALILAQKETGSALAYTALFFVLYREGMSGLILAAAATAVIIFVTTLKYTTTQTLGIPTGEFAVFIIVEAIIVAMLQIYCKLPTAARNTLIWFAATGLLARTLNAIIPGGLPINGATLFIAIIAVAIIYCLLLTFRYASSRLLITIAAAIAAIIFMFGVNFVFNNILQPHQQKRIQVTLGIIEDLRDSGYNVNQAKIAIGSGGIAGKGFLNGTQTKLKYVPEQHTDFIFCTIGEEEGFIGASIIMILFLTLILRVITLAERQPTNFGRVYAYCVASFLIFHLAINVGMVIGLCPVIGIPLPFLSYGGSSLWGFTFLLFILLRIDAARRQHHRY